MDSGQLDTGQWTVDSEPPTHGGQNTRVSRVEPGLHMSVCHRLMAIDQHYVVNDYKSSVRRFENIGRLELNTEE